jgi:hypothetical protein
MTNRKSQNQASPSWMISQNFLSFEQQIGNFKIKPHLQNAKFNQYES